MDLTHALMLGQLPSDFPLPLDRPFTHQTAREVGLRPNQLTALVTAGALSRPLRGVYVAATTPDSTRLRLACLRLVIPVDSVVCDRHAGWLHGAEMVLAPGEHLQVMPLTIFRRRGHGRLRNGLVDGGVSAATRNCPETATRLPTGGHENCPLTVMGSARHNVVCLTALRGLGPFLGCDERC